jgi:SAM-dependent methyltransferase
MMPEVGAMRPTASSSDIQRSYRVRIGLLLGGILVALFVLNTATRTVNTLRQLEVVEAERDRWQRPDDVLAALDAGQGKVVVDLGSGAGYFALKLSHVVGPQGRVLAVDVRRLPLLFLWMRTRLRGRRNVTIVRGDPDDPHLAPGAADAVLVANTFHELDEQGTVLSQARRALRSGGRLVVVDPAPDTAEHAGAEAHHHELPERAEARLRRAGLEIVAREDRFIEGPNGRWWLIVARRGGRS